jgi:type IX secretion system PorP/SprF family membrane protein
MKKSLSILAALFCGTLAFGQQDPQSSQYLQNIYVINPAASGLTDYVDINLSYRQQWAGFEGAPQTYYISGNSLLGRGGMGSNKIFALRVSDPYISLDDKEVNVDNEGTVVNRKLRHAVGASLIVDKAGAFRRNFGAVSYAIHLPLAEKLNLSAGLKVGLNNYIVDPSLLVTQSGSDATVSNFNSDNTANELDVNIGFLFYGDKFYAGYSSGQLLGNDLEFGPIPGRAKAQAHHYLIGAYRFELSDKVGLTPSTLVKITNAAPTTVDLTAKVDLERKFWLGFSYRNQDAFVTMLGVRVGNYLNVGYSYDITTSDLNKVSNGSHEFVVNIMLGKK